jgi:hypothetical protein
MPRRLARRHLEDLMIGLTRVVVTFLTVATGVLLVSSPASADRRSDCAEARTFLRSSTARQSCSARYHSARNLFCSSASGQRLLFSMARSCKARVGAAPSSPSSPSAPSGTNDVDNIPVCKAYFTRLLACPPAKGPVSRQEEANIKKRELQQKLDKGSKVEIIGGACQVLDKVLKC